MGKYDFKFDLYENSTLSWIAKDIAKGSKVLEFGSANGRLTKYLNEEKDCIVDIVEIDEEAGLEAAKYANQALVGSMDGDIEKFHWLELANDYDYIVFADVLEHLKNPKEVLNRCKVILKETGRILVSIPNIAHNSVIIELMNDRFEYNEIGLLDNTHLRFFTKSSFQRMAEQIGWAIVGERATYIRVGENEIINSYQDVSKEVYKELLKRDSGNIYQYMFTLAFSSEYLLGQCERQVCLDTYSHYYVECLFDNNDVFDYRKSVSKYINPAQGLVKIEIPILENSKKAKIHPINCNCIFQINQFLVVTNDGVHEVKDFYCNGKFVNGDYYFLEDIPCLEFSIDEQDTTVILDIRIIKYDFSDDFFNNLCKSIIQKEEQIKKICGDYEAEIEKKEMQIKETCKVYEAEIERRGQEQRRNLEKKEEQIKEICKAYETEITKKDQEFHESAQIYEEVIAQKDEEIIKKDREIQRLSQRFLKKLLKK